MFDPAPNLPDDTFIEMVRFSPSIRKSLKAAGFKTIREIRAMSDHRLWMMRGVGAGSFCLRATIGLKSIGRIMPPRPSHLPYSLERTALQNLSATHGLPLAILHPWRPSCSSAGGASRPQLPI
jgi:hypothetical protein